MWPNLSENSIFPMIVFYGYPSLPPPSFSYLDEHRLEVLLAGVHVPLEVLVDPLEDQPQLGVAVHAVLSNQPETGREK